MLYNVPKKVNVPELFYQRFLKDIPIVNTQLDQSPQNTLLSKLVTITPTKRGQGMTRWLKGDTAINQAEWNALYELAAKYRKKMQGAEDRKITLRAAICARALAERMEKIGVDTPITYTPKFRVTRKKTDSVEETTVITTDTDLSSSLPVNPPVVDQSADVDEANDSDLGYMHDELDVG